MRLCPHAGLILCSHARFIDDVLALFLPHRITAVKHLKGVKKEHLTFPPNTAGALQAFALEAVKKYVVYKKYETPKRYISIVQCQVQGSGGIDGACVT